MAKTLERYDATTLIGLPVIVLNAATEKNEVGEDGETESYINVPRLGELAAAAAVVRCLMPPRLRGKELKAIRKILGMTARELSESMGEGTAVETISRWENEKEVLGGYAEKLLRLTICERLKDKAPGIVYDTDRLIRMKMVETDRKSEGFPTRPIVFCRVLVKSDKDISDSWTSMKDAA